MKINTFKLKNFLKVGVLLTVAFIAAIATHQYTKRKYSSSQENSINSVVDNVKYNTYPQAEFPMDLGMGFNWFEHLGSGGYYARWEKYPLSTQTYPDMEDAEGWAAIEKGLNELNPGWIRFGMPPNPHIDKDGEFNGKTVHFEHLIWLDKWATKNNKVILLDMFLMPEYYEFPVPEGIKNPGEHIVNMAAKNNREYAQNFVAPMIDYVVNTLKLNSVKYFNPINEPMDYGVYQTPNNTPDAMLHYVDMFKEIRAAIDAKGIDRKRIGLIGFDSLNPNEGALKEMALGIDISPYINAYSLHHYNLRMDHLPPSTNPDVQREYFLRGMNATIEKEDKMFLDFAHQQNKPVWALEMGTFYYGKWTNPDGVASLDATITVSEGIIRATNIGITSFCIWALMNPNDVDGHWAIIGENNGELVKYKYPFALYSLISSHLLPNSKVFPIMPSQSAPEIVHVQATALESSMGDKTMLVVNNHATSDIEVEFDLPKEWKDVKEFELRIADKNRLNKKIKNLKVVNGKVKIRTKAFSLLGLKAV